ncbi:hypothetical protein Saro_3192 [Novosphingobium aromaticivorans DSM 12444]|uniref:Uncharacterized protein n=2 Tax=Novosphingobium aromaticivorans TaxID=48935 RepID=Q2G3E6_NOVAD|nr:hypothetical protein Saro_3192 [Novosphingobium aromaticivorans DSM 12444]SCY32124.1 hypothetical protein SAMN05660666_01419 [Novosphingobium aromaticivorans]
MMSNTLAASAADARRAHVEALLSAYPDVTPEERELLVNWFRKDATALDVALVASNPAAERGYRRFRAQHVDRFTLKDMGRALAFAAAIAVCILLIAWRAL